MRICEHAEAKINEVTTACCCCDGTEVGFDGIWEYMREYANL